MYNFNSILDTLKTTDEAKYMLSSLETLLENQFKTQGKEPSEEFKKEVTIPAYATLSKCLSENKVSLNQRTLASEFLKQLRESIEQIPVLTLTIAFVPLDRLVAKIFQEVEGLVQERFLLNIVSKGYVLGGAIILYKGRYKDYSVKTKLEEVFRNKRNEIFKT